eukprot:3833644-Rhodomonas_salina.2
MALRCWHEGLKGAVFTERCCCSGCRRRVERCSLPPVNRHDAQDHAITSQPRIRSSRRSPEDKTIPSQPRG